MKANLLMSVQVITIPPELSLESAHRLMMTNSMRHLPVVSGNRLAGILSDRDILLSAGRGPGAALVYPDITAGEVMSLAPVSAGPNVPLAELARTMVAGKFDALPIISEDGTLVGLVTSTDLMRALSMSAPDTALAWEIRRASDLMAKA